jgi:ATP-dependent exoDNAse (exonuclease V) alpha subunit
VVVVDEAAMIGTRDLDRLLGFAARDRANVVLVGDDKQLPAINAGGAFTALARTLGAVELTENRRQVEAWERAALDELRSGNLPTAVRAYEEHGRIVTGASVDEVRARLVNDWFAAGGDGLMLATRRHEVAELNQRARVVMNAHEKLAAAAMLTGGIEFRVGDHVMATRNDRRVGLLNGTRGTVVAVDPYRGRLTIETDARRVDVPSSYLEAGHLTYGYAMTVHKAQGATTDHAFLLGDEALFREAGYVAMSRGRQANTCYVVEGDAMPMDTLARRLGRSNAKMLGVHEHAAVFDAVGERPTHRVDAWLWDKAVQQAVDYRERWNVTDADTALGAKPTDRDQLLDYLRASRGLRDIQHREVDHGIGW